MTWVVWRQHRTEGLVTLGVLVVIGAFLLITGLNMRHTFQVSGLGACLAQHPADSTACGPLQTAFLHHYGLLLYVVGGLLVLPVLLGALVGAPLVAREYEQRTHLLVWMQSITRSRWLVAQVGLVLGAGLVVAGALMGLLMWWYSPFAQFIGSFNQLAFDFSGPVFVAAMVLALALGIFAGTVTRSQVFAIFLTLALLLAIRLPVEFGLRPNYAPQITVTWPLAQGNTPPVTLGKQDWHIADGFLDAQGNRTDGVYCSGDNQTPQQCMQAAGYRGYYLAYQPADRFWPFQWTETGIYLALAALAIGATAWLVRRRLG